MHAVCKVPFCHTQYNKKAVFLEFYCLLSIYFWGRVFDNLGGAGEQIKILGHLFTPGFQAKILINLHFFRDKNWSSLKYDMVISKTACMFTSHLSVILTTFIF